MANKNTRKNPNKAKQQQANIQRARAQANAQAQAQGNQKREKGRFRAYFKGVRTEMKKVVWPTKQELGSYTGLVLVACTFFALLFWAVDTGVLAALRGLLGIDV